MYRAIELISEDKDLHRFVWRSSPEEVLKDYRMTRITFGVSASSFIVCKEECLWLCSGISTCISGGEGIILCGWWSNRCWHHWNGHTVTTTAAETIWQRWIPATKMELERNYCLERHCTWTTRPATPAHFHWKGGRVHKNSRNRVECTSRSILIDSRKTIASNRSYEANLNLWHCQDIRCVRMDSSRHYQGKDSVTT